MGIVGPYYGITVSRDTLSAICCGWCGGGGGWPFSLICRTRSRVRSNLAPISSKVRPWLMPMPKNSFTTSRSRSVRVLSARSISLAQGFVQQQPVGRCAVVVGQHVQQAVALTLHEWGVHADVATAHLHGVCHFLGGQVQQGSKLIGAGRTLIFLLQAWQRPC
jgi:hypothetical protein